MNIILANVFGFLALLISIYMYQAKNKRDLFLRQLIYTFFMLIEFILLKVYIALYITIISFFRTLLYYNYQKNNKKIPNVFLGLIIFLFFISLFFNHKNIFSIIPLLIGVIYTLTLLINNVNKIKIICIILSILWIIYYLIIQAYVSIIKCIIDIIAIIYSLKKDFKK